MKNFLLLISLCLCSAISHAKTYYVSPTGNDANTGTITSPFRNWDKLCDVMIAGDIAYIRGGTYASTKGPAAGAHCYFQNLHGTSTNWITIQNYPGEQPILDCSNIGEPTALNPALVYTINCSFVHFKGLHVRNLQQICCDQGISRGWDLDTSPNCILEQIEVDHIGGGGFHLINSNDVTYLNCDSHHNGDGNSGGSAGAWGGADGFSCTGQDPSTRTTYTGCRSWLNSDDGWDNFKTDGIRTWNNCWSFWNGYRETSPGVRVVAGDGDGFKLGPANPNNTNDIPTTLRFLNNCFSFENGLHGFENNGVPTMQYQIYNCTAYKCLGNGFEFGYQTVYPGLTDVFKNNLAYANGGYQLRYCGANSGNSNNTWSSGTSGAGGVCGWTGGMSVTNADFASVSDVGVDGPRQADGSLPNLNFMHLANGSHLIDAGVNVGLPYNATAPDLGAFEKSSGTVPVTLVDFSASEKTAKTLLQWTTATEINSSYFEVERSIDGRNFVAIGSVNGAGNSNTTINYQFTDNSPETGINYYRLKTVDQDGQYQYSKTVSVTFKSSNPGSVDIKYAMINNKTLQLNLSSSIQQQAELSMYDAVGQLLFASNITLQKGMNNVSKTVIPASAVYYLKLKTDQESITKPLFNGQ